MDALRIRLPKIGDRSRNAVGNLMSLLEPLVILYIGFVVGGLVVAMYLPIFQLGSVFM